MLQLAAAGHLKTPPARAGLMDILQLALDTRKIILVDLALGLIQRLVAHQHLVGPVTAVTHKREQGTAPKRKGEEDDEAADAAVDGVVPPQVRGGHPAARLASSETAFRPALQNVCVTVRLTVPQVCLQVQRSCILGDVLARRRVPEHGS